jgi:hypothetical protein
MGGISPGKEGLIAEIQKKALVHHSLSEYKDFSSSLDIAYKLYFLGYGNAHKKEIFFTPSCNPYCLSEKRQFRSFQIELKKIK